MPGDNLGSAGQLCKPAPLATATATTDLGPLGHSLRVDPDRAQQGARSPPVSTPRGARRPRRASASASCHGTAACREAVRGESAAALAPAGAGVGPWARARCGAGRMDTPQAGPRHTRVPAPLVLQVAPPARGLATARARRWPLAFSCVAAAPRLPRRVRAERLAARKALRAAATVQAYRGRGGDR